MTDLSSQVNPTTSRLTSHPVLAEFAKTCPELATLVSACHALSFSGIPVSVLVEDYVLALMSRSVDDREQILHKQSKVFFQISGAGHESVLLAFSRFLRPSYDWFFPYYRDRALMLGLGVSPYTMFLQSVGSSADPASSGRQMPCHWGFADLHVVSQTSATASQCIPAVGCAEASRFLQHHQGIPLASQPDEITYVSLGDGSCAEGEVFESLLTACKERLPVLYLVADNGYAISTRTSDQLPASPVDLLSGFKGLHRFQVDGSSYPDCFKTAEKATRLIRSGAGPVFVQAKVPRPYSHSAADTQSKYRHPDDLLEESRRDPLALLRSLLEVNGLVHGTVLDSLESSVSSFVAEAAARALAAPRPLPETAMENVVRLPELVEMPVETTPELFDVQADAEPVMLGASIQRALSELMQDIPSIRVFGEDVADASPDLMSQVEGKGGVFGTTKGLQTRFGSDRVFNTPLAEANIVGRAIGQAVRGLHPCPEIQFFDYIWPAMTQLKTEAATLRWRSNGQFTCPMVVRVPIGGYLRGGSIWHSQCGESIFTHIPGLLVAFPSNARDAVGLLRQAFSLEDPVLFLEHKHLLRQAYAASAYPAPHWSLPFGKASVVRKGLDLTIVTWGACVEKSLQASCLLDDQGVSVEVVDLRTLAPWDKETVLDSVAKTSRLLVVHEDVLTNGFGSEVVSVVSDEAFTSLDAPPRRLTTPDCHVPYAPELEDHVLPQIPDIVSASMKLLRF